MIKGNQLFWAPAVEKQAPLFAELNTWKKKCSELYPVARKGTDKTIRSQNGCFYDSETLKLSLASSSYNQKEELSKRN